MLAVAYQTRATEIETDVTSQPHQVDLALMKLGDSGDCPPSPFDILQ